jgi:endo-1,3(4)-beta-glucanase
LTRESLCRRIGSRHHAFDNECNEFLCKCFIGAIKGTSTCDGIAGSSRNGLCHRGIPQGDSYSLSIVGFQELTHAGRKSRDGIVKYILNLTDGSTWLLYVVPSNASSIFQLTSLESNIYIASNGNFSGTTQLAKLPKNYLSDVYDKTYGVYAVNATISGSTTNNKGRYTISWTKAGVHDRELLIFLLPHHLESMSVDSRSKVPSLFLHTPTNGVAVALMTNNITLLEPDLPSTVGFLPWSPDRKIDKICSKNSTVYGIIDGVAKSEVTYDLVGRLSREDSTYWAGKEKQPPNFIKNKVVGIVRIRQRQ